MKGRHRLAVTNRGEIALRVLKAGQELGWDVAFVVAHNDEKSWFCQFAPQVLTVSSYLASEEIVECVAKWGAHFVHPGYGFLSENADFARLVESRGMVFVGPSAETMEQLGQKEKAKRLALSLGIPAPPALTSDILQATPVDQWEKLLEKNLLYPPYLVKANGGGGGRGMRIVHSIQELPAALLRASEEARSAFGDARVFVERYLSHARHIEIQVFGDGQGKGIFLGERECSLQRRHQKVLEEAPSPFVDRELRRDLGEAALTLVRETHYRGAGTVEFLVTADKKFFFLEVNTRLQVEHPVTECVFGVDLVKAQLQLATGVWPSELTKRTDWQNPEPFGWSFEARILAEDAKNNFLPSPGPVEIWTLPEEIKKSKPSTIIRLDAGVGQGGDVHPGYDSLMGKLVVWAPTRDQALKAMIEVLKRSLIGPCRTNQDFLLTLLEDPDVASGQFSTEWLERNMNHLVERMTSHQDVQIFRSRDFVEKLEREWIQSRGTSTAARIFSSLKKEKFSLERSSGTQNTFHVRMRSRDDVVPCAVFFRGRQGVWDICHPRGLTEVESFWNEDLCVHEADHLADLGFEVKAPLAGKVLQLHVQDKSHVGKGVLLCVLESMKMQIEIRAPQSGIIEHMDCKQGGLVAGGATLMWISPESSVNGGQGRSVKDI